MNIPITNLASYPQTGEHQYVDLDLGGIEITKGMDTWFYTDENGKERNTSTKKWVVHIPEFEFITNGMFPITKQFITVEKAVAYAINYYEQYLRNELQRVMKLI